ncbi:hypothetical protein ACWDUD_22175 [Rhodococcus sp. NPDC003382]
MGEHQGRVVEAGRISYGAQPLPQQLAVAPALRRLVGLVMSLEDPHPVLDEMAARLADWERDLASVAPPDQRPRIGPDADDARRVYVDHAYDIGAFNPCFPEYVFDRLDADHAEGRVTFPLAFEGPPGLVHGGFLGVFFDSVTQHQSCAVGVSGKTRSLTVTYRRPTPLATELQFTIDRTVGERGIDSTARLLLDGDVLCTGVVNTVAADVGTLAGTRYGTRRNATG